ncbi:protein of unknown function [Ralstonia solanacearum CFBP2957]|nr:protein of unknown function [Ralstonia solanacearum CFBP2957]
MKLWLSSYRYVLCASSHNVI